MTREPAGSGTNAGPTTRGNDGPRLRITGYPQPEGGECPMRIITTLAAAALIAASATVAMAQGSAGGGGVGASGGGGTGGTAGAGADPSTPRQNLTRPTPNSPSVNKRGDDMAPL